MTANRLGFDVVVVGAGTAGAAAAAFLAEAGRRVAMVEALPLADAGARWVNAVPDWIFEAAGIDPPAPPEDMGTGGSAVFLDPCDKILGRIQNAPVRDLDMRKLVSRLQQRALAAGVEVFDQAEILDLELDDERPVELSIRARRQGTEAGFRLAARLFVDASGQAGALRRLVPALARHCPGVAPADLCAAAQEVAEISDREGARTFLERTGASAGELVTWTGMAGSFSTTSILIEEDLSRATLLTGSIADGLHPSGLQLMADLRQREPWLGRAVFGGDGLIPLRRPYDRLTSDGVALVGDSGCMVFPPHGSGVGNGLVAARLLADAVSDADDIGDHASLWGFQAAYQRERGAVAAAFDVFRRLSQNLSPRNNDRLISCGLLTEASMTEVLTQRMPSSTMDNLVHSMKQFHRAPLLVARIAPSMARLLGVHALYRRYPLVPDVLTLVAWSRSVSTLLGVRPDLDN